MGPEVEKCASFYVAYLRYLATLYQTRHWESHGIELYAQHLLFERLYNSASEDLDQAAEKMVGMLGSGVVNLTTQVGLVKSIDGKDLEEIETEKYFGKFLKHFLKILGPEIDLGVDDLIRTHASNSESRVYLMKNG